VGPDPGHPLIASVGSELFEHPFELALLRAGQLAQDPGVGDADRGFGTLQQSAALTAQRGR
jgi:hypothetical protein